MSFLLSSPASSARCAAEIEALPQSIMAANPAANPTFRSVRMLPPCEPRAPECYCQNAPNVATDIAGHLWQFIIAPKIDDRDDPGRLPRPRRPGQTWSCRQPRPAGRQFDG